MFEVSLEGLLDSEVIITDTFNEKGLGYKMAESLKHFTKRVWCVDPRYKITKRDKYEIEDNGKTIHIKGNMEQFQDAKRVMGLIHNLGGKPLFYFRTRDEEYRNVY